MMKNKINKWGNSHGIRLSAMMLDHLNADNGDQLEIILTNKGIEIIKNISPADNFKVQKQQIIDGLIKSTCPVQTVSDPTKESLVDYMIIDIDPCQPIIREVPKGYNKAYKNLADAKYAARKLVQQSIQTSKKALADIRQVGIEKIKYINL